ncbi:hypothetical protein N826_06550 [Skermanella aerolata KACC 11604]|nr:hypothetical protein N826_06550 [Skermanella aerolata KACC 11604]
MLQRILDLQSRKVEVDLLFALLRWIEERRKDVLKTYPSG